MGWGTDAHGVVGRVLWHCSGRLQVYGSSCGGEGYFWREMSFWVVRVLGTGLGKGQ
nr:hypothetical protein [Tanacetum cinerariifolium]